MLLYDPSAYIDPEPINQSSDCDSPFALTNFTLDHLEKHWADEVDFVVCPSFAFSPPFI